MMKIWQTPFIKADIMPYEHQETLLYKVGNMSIINEMDKT